MILLKHEQAVVDRLANVHDSSKCAGRSCVIHAPLDHHMREWKLYWRGDRGIFERICPCHGVGHPDPSQFAYWLETDQMYQSIHGCILPPCCSASNNKSVGGQ